jgi:hypothetical protein
VSLRIHVILYYVNAWEYRLADAEGNLFSGVNDFDASLQKYYGETIIKF